MKTFSPKDPKYYLDDSHEPIGIVEELEELSVEVFDTYTNQLQSEKDSRKDIDYRKLTPLTGPLFIENCPINSTLIVRIKGIKLAPKGVMPLMHGMGIRGQNVNEVSTKIFPIDRERIVFSDTLILPTKPMIGTIGVAPKGDPIRAFTPGDFGGNMDFVGIGVGATVLLPVQVPGGLLYMGDLHAIQGDGELNGTGLEVAGSIHFSVSVISDLIARRPIVINGRMISFIASHRSLEKAIEIAVDDAIEKLESYYSLDYCDAYRLLSLIGNIRICQIVNPRVTVRLDISTNYLNPGVLIKGGLSR